MAIVHSFGTLVISMDGKGEHVVELRDGFHLEGENGENVQEAVSDIIRKIGMNLIRQEDGVYKPLAKRLRQELENNG